MTSMGWNEVGESTFVPTFKISGSLYHRIGSLLSPPQESAKFLKIYFVGDDDRRNCSISEMKILVKDSFIQGLHKRQTNAPSSSEVAVVINVVMERLEKIFPIIILPDYICFNFLPFPISRVPPFNSTD